MTPERWSRIDQLLQDALDRALAERGAFLAEACDDDDIRREVESLLGFHDRLGDFIAAPPAALAADLLAEQESRAGQRIGHYQLIREIGRGGMGEVYLARDTRLGRQVALKLLPPRFSRDAQRVRRFRQEARAASALNHPNILTIHEIGEVESEGGAALYLATEYIEGGTLRELIREGGGKAAEALEVGTQVAGALSAAHAAGITHRDIKPENVMLRPDGYVKVVDFGLAKLNGVGNGDWGPGIGREGRGRESMNSQSGIRNPAIRTDSGVVMGTASYMSPEQARGQEVDGRTDIFSLGVVLYELVTGRRPFGGETTSDVIAAVLREDPEPLGEGAPQGLEEVIGRMLAKKKEERYQTAEEVRRELKKVKKGMGAAEEYTTREYWNLAEVARRAGGGDEYKTKVERAWVGGGAGRRGTSGIRARLRRLTRTPARLTLTVAALALAVVAAITGRHWLVKGDAPVNSIAVLPFAGAIVDPQLEYLPDGITEGLIRNLSQLPGLRVMAGGTVFTDKGRDVDPRQIGTSLNARALVTGRVEERGDLLTVEVELVDARDGARIWGEQLRRPAPEIIGAQNEISRHIATALRLTPNGEEPLRSVRSYTANAEAYHLYLKGRYFFSQSTKESGQKALGYFRQAINIDSQYALAYAGVGYASAFAAGRYELHGEGMRQAREASTRALELDNELPEAHFAMALVHWWADWNWGAAETEFKRALELNPNQAQTHSIYAEFLTTRGRFAEALDQARRARELDPLSIYVNNSLGDALCEARQYDGALTAYRQALELNPNGAWTRRGIGRVYLKQGKYDEAIDEFHRAISLDPQSLFISDLGFALGLAGRRADAARELALIRRAVRVNYVSPVLIARIYAGMGNKKDALDCLDKAYLGRPNQLAYLRIDPAFDGLRSDPRFDEPLRRLGLTP